MFDPVSSAPDCPFGTVELTPVEGTRTLDPSHDLSSLVCGRSAVGLAIQLRWLCWTILVLGGVAPNTVVFARHWADGGPGQFALAYAWPLWLELWVCVGWWLSVCALSLWWASMQHQIAWRVLTQFSTLWVVLMTGVCVAGLISLHEDGLHRSTWVVLPVYIGCALIFPLIAMADALPPGLRLHVLRIFGPFALLAACTVVLGLRLPTAKDTPGEIKWTVMGTETVTNHLHALRTSGTVVMVLIAKGVFRAWMFPDRLAFIQTSLRIAENECAVVAPAHKAPGEADPPASYLVLEERQLGERCKLLKTASAEPSANSAAVQSTEAADDTESESSAGEAKMVAAAAAESADSRGSCKPRCSCGLSVSTANTAIRDEQTWNTPRTVLLEMTTFEIGMMPECGR